MSKRLTKKQAGFVRDYLKTGNGSLAAKKNYEIEAEDADHVARSIATENLTKPVIKDAIQRVLNDEYLAEKHASLFKQKRVDYFVFPKFMSDEEIVEHVASVGIKVITVRESDKGKMAFYAIDDANAIKAALDMAYKIKSTYAPEKSLNVNIDVETSTEINKLTDELNALHRGPSKSGHGGTSGVVGEEVQDQE